MNPTQPLATIPQQSEPLSFIRSRIRNGVRNYAVFYGHGHINELRQFDVMVVDPRAYSAAERAQLKARIKGGEAGQRPILIGYLTCSEVLPNDPILQQVEEADYYRVNGVPLRVPGSNAYVMDLRQTHWRQLLLNQVQQMLFDGFDGVFLDTLAIGEDPQFPPAVGQGFLESAGLFVSGIRGNWPNNIIVQNWGIHQLKNYTLSNLDVICWENFQVQFVETDQWSKNRLAELIQIRNTGFPIWTLYNMTEAQADDAAYQAQMYKYSRSYRFIPYCALPNYTAGVNVGPLQAGL
ncbi:MAG: hypothetical protein K1Y36_03025 [Blastocatellia bacterium]|nr:hypothetical protein [Blastocatellia bacterium]